MYELWLGLVGTAGHAPVPAGHGLGVSDRIFGAPGIEDGDAAAPFEVTDQRRAELRVGWQADVVRGIEKELHPSLALWLVEHFADMVGDHDGVTTAVIRGVFWGATEYFADEVGDVTRVVGGHVLKDRADKVVLQYFVVKDPEEVL